MTINKRIIRIVRKKLPLFIGCTLLCIISVAFIIASTTAGNSLSNTIADFYTDTNVEDASFVTATELHEDDIISLQNKFDVQIERMDYFDSDNSGNTLRVFKQTEQINLYEIVEGQDISSDSQILINKLYAEENGLDIGDIVTAGSNEYEICGFFTRPDYLYPLKNTSDSYISDEFGIALLSANAFESHNNIFSYYSVIYNDNNSVEFREYVHENFTFANYLPQNKNPRIYMAPDQSKGVSNMASMYGPVLFILTIGFVVIVLSKIIKQDQKELGTVSAFGYRKRELISFYTKFALLIAIVGSLFGIIVGMLLSKPITEFYASDYNFPVISGENSYNIASIIIGVVTPILLLVITAFLLVSVSLKKDVISLLRNNLNEREKRSRNILRNSKWKNNTKYSIRVAVRNKSRTFVFFLGIFIASAIILMAFIMNSSLNSVIENELEENSNYEYTYKLNQVLRDYDGKGEAVIGSSLEYRASGSSITLLGIPEDSAYYSLYSVDEDQIDVNNGFYISRAISEMLDIQEGDTMILIDPITTKEYEITVSGISNLNKQKTIYSSMDNVNQLLGLETGSYNYIISDKELYIDESLLLSISKSSDFAKTLETMTRPISSVVQVLVILGLVLGILVVYMITSMMVEENQNNISMLKVLGYRTKEISKMIFGINKYIVFVAYSISMPVMLWVCKTAFKADVETYNMYIPAKITIVNIVISICIILASYYIALLISRRKVIRVSMVESLKDNRE